MEKILREFLDQLEDKFYRNTDDCNPCDCNFPTVYDEDITQLVEELRVAYMKEMLH